MVNYNKKKRKPWIDVKYALPITSHDVEVLCHHEITVGYYYNDVWHIEDAPDPDWGVTHWR